MGEFSVWHWLIVAAVLVLLFGANRLPEAARSIGRSLRIFHSEVRKMDDDEKVPARPVDPGADEGRSRTPPAP
ncbi:Sec-independent protein translocase subunit TatA [Sphaerisporangium sp. NPDC051011]|uniref:Sec-independent protein translocase subunit TatA n=1 Tax=Sphaerisporangium sp. NPDC051011 TaxID=3155792 RepID=UPI0033D0C58B